MRLDLTEVMVMMWGAVFADNGKLEREKLRIRNKRTAFEFLAEISERFIEPCIIVKEPGLLQIHETLNPAYSVCGLQYLQFDSQQIRNLHASKLAIQISDD